MQFSRHSPLYLGKSSHLTKNSKPLERHMCRLRYTKDDSAVKPKSSRVIGSHVTRLGPAQQLLQVPAIMWSQNFPSGVFATTGEALVSHSHRSQAEQHCTSQYN